MLKSCERGLSIYSIGNLIHVIDFSQSDSEEVLPFNLDENFDYDNVVLSSKHLLPQFNTGV